MGIRDEMFRAKVLIFMVPLVLPIGQPPARATDGQLQAVECAPWPDDQPAMSLTDRPTPAPGNFGSPGLEGRLLPATPAADAP